MQPTCKRTTEATTRLNNEWPSLIARVRTGMDLYDIITGQKLTFVRPGTAVKQFADRLVILAANTPVVEKSGTVLKIEGSSANINTWSNEFTAARGHTLTDCTTETSASEYIILDSNGTPLYATKLIATANNGRVGKYAVSVTAGTPMAVSIYAKKGLGRARFTGYDGTNSIIGFFNFDTGLFSDISDPGNQLVSFKAYPFEGGWYRLECVWIPGHTASNGASSIGLEMSGNWCYISGSQFESNAKIASSYIHTEGSTVTRASAGADTSGNGLQLQLSPAMIASLSAGGAGTICQWVDLPYDSSAVPNSTAVILYTTTNSTASARIAMRRSSGGEFHAAYMSDGTNTAYIASERPAGRYCLISQWSAALGKMRVGLYNPATGALTWSRPTLAGATPYRGFFPIHSSNRLRWAYGLGNLPLGIGEMGWFNRILSNSEILQFCEETKI